MDNVYIVAIAICVLTLIVLTHSILMKVLEKSKLNIIFKQDKAIMVFSYTIGLSFFFLLLKIFELIK